MKTFFFKIFIASFLMLILGRQANAQVSANLILNNRPPSYFSDWNSALAGQLLVTFNGPVNTLQVKFATQLQDANGTVLAISNNATAQSQTIVRGANIIRLDRVLQLENMRFTGGGNGLATSGKLSAGQYSLSVQLLRIPDDSVLTPLQQRMFTQINYQLPFLLSPNDKGWLDANAAQTAITFRWSSLSPVSQEAATYRLQVYEVLPMQTSMQSLRSNQPILLTDVNRLTQYIWRPQLSFKDSATHTFIWTVQTLDSKGIPVTSDAGNQGRSEPRVFGICNQKAGTDAAECGKGFSW